MFILVFLLRINFKGKKVKAGNQLENGYEPRQHNTAYGSNLVVLSTGQFIA